MRDLLGSLLAGVLTVAFVILFMNYQKQGNLNMQVAATAQQATQFNTAVQSYITQYSSNISAVATASTPATITVAMLQAPAVGLLPSSFSATNPFGQTWQAQVLQPTAGNLNALALGTGGTQLTDQVASRVAALIGAPGGFIPLNDSGTWPTGASTAQGAYAGWSLPTAGFTGIAGGNIASLLTFSNGQFVSNYLYRNNVGNTSLNTMNTPIIMASTQTIGGACATNGAIAQNGTGLALTCQSNVWTSNIACPQYSGDLNVLEGLAGTKSCVNGAGMGNAPSADWYFVDTYRHVNSGNFYAVQTAYAMTGANVGIPYTRVQQSGVAGAGWGAWKSASAKGLGLGGETWHAVARSFGTTYCNGFTYPIAVGISGGPNPSPGWGDLALYIDGVLIEYSVGNWNGGSGYLNAFGIVAPGSCYRATSGRFGKYSWAEMY